MMDLAALATLPIDTREPFAVLADLHANIEALEAVDAWLEERGVSQALVLGDLIGYGASPHETVGLVRARDWSVIRGNHEDMLLDLSHVEKTRSLKREARKAIDWTLRRLSEETLAYFETLPLAARVGEDAIAVHGSLVDPRYCYAYIYEFSLDLNARRLRELATPAGTIAFFGHTHRAGVFAVGPDDVSELDADRGSAPLREGPSYLVNPGSVGFPRDRDPRSSLMIYDPTTRHLEVVRLKYDVEAAARKIRTAGYEPALASRLLAAR